jgi:hypothetical protein
MATASLWKAVGVAVQSALATALTITGITKASPGVVTYTGTDPANGDYVKLTVVGMYQLDGVIARVAGVDTGANTFQLEGIDTTLYDTFVSGTAEVITFGTNLTTATSINASGGDFDFIDVTTIHDNVKKQIPGLPNPATYTMDLLWDPSDAAFTELKDASDNQQQLAVRFTFANGKKVLFLGYVGFSGLPVGSAQDKVTTQAVITGFGKPTVYAS